MLVRPGHATELLTAGAGMVLEVMRDSPRSAGRIHLEPSSTLLLYSDGLVERRGEDLDAGTARLTSLVAELADDPLPAFCDELLARSQPGTTDDIALLAVRVVAPART